MLGVTKLVFYLGKEEIIYRKFASLTARAQRRKERDAFGLEENFTARSLRLPQWRKGARKRTPSAWRKNLPQGRFAKRKERKERKGAARDWVNHHHSTKSLAPGATGASRLQAEKISMSEYKNDNKILILIKIEHKISEVLAGKIFFC
jgi:hypothetical protein